MRLMCWNIILKIGSMMIKMKRNRLRKLFWNIGLKSHRLINILKLIELKKVNDVFAET
jgi:hypothetical protein